MTNTIRYERTGRVARITLDRPEHGNAITMAMPRELAACVERANVDPEVHCILLSGAGSGFCGGYDLGLFAEGSFGGEPGASAPGGDERRASAPGGEPGGSAPGGDEPRASVLDPTAHAANHDPRRTWDPMLDYQMMSRNVRGFMSLYWSDLPVICKVHGFCVAGGTDMALCSDLLVIAADAKIGYPPSRVWGSPTTSVWAFRIGVQRAARLLFTGDCLTGAKAAEWGLAIEAPAPAELDQRCEEIVGRVARLPRNQLIMMKLLLNQTLGTQGLHATQVLGTVFDGITRHTSEGYAFADLAASDGWKAAVRARDEPFGDYGMQWQAPR